VILGAAGFIGQALTARLAAKGVRVRAVIRDQSEQVAGVETVRAGTLGHDSAWPALFKEARAVIHLASRAHQPPGAEDWIETEVQTATALAQAACKAGVARIVFLSSIKAMGEVSGDRPLRADMPPQPVDAYGRAKLAIETALRRGPDLVVLRPPLVYGPGVKGNFRALLRLAAAGIPLPLASIHNRRSFIFLDNLLDLIASALDHPAAPGHALLMRDDEELSTPALFQRLAQKLKRRARLFPFPPALLEASLRAAGRASAANALLRSLSVDDQPTRTLLGWQPRASLDEGVAATCRWFESAAQ
jgi:nucleoside-diphosphate-sugar epimerase